MLSFTKQTFCLRKKRYDHHRHEINQLRYYTIAPSNDWQLVSAFPVCESYPTAFWNIWASQRTGVCPAASPKLIRAFSIDRIKPTHYAFHPAVRQIGNLQPHLFIYLLSFNHPMMDGQDRKYEAYEVFCQVVFRTQDPHTFFCRSSVRSHTRNIAGDGIPFENEVKANVMNMIAYSRNFNVDIDWIATCLADAFVKQLFNSFGENSYTVYVRSMNEILAWSHEFFAQFSNRTDDWEAFGASDENIYHAENKKEFLVAWGMERIKLFRAGEEKKSQYGPLQRNKKSNQKKFQINDFRMIKWFPDSLRPKHKRMT
jgi:hypothetical protein